MPRLCHGSPRRCSSSDVRLSCPHVRLECAEDVCWHASSDGWRTAHELLHSWRSFGSGQRVPPCHGDEASPEIKPCEEEHVVPHHLAHRVPSAARFSRGARTPTGALLRRFPVIRSARVFALVNPKPKKDFDRKHFSKKS